MLRFLLACVLIIIISKTHAQFNDSTFYYTSFSSTGSINKTQSASSYLLNNGLKLSAEKKSIEANFNANWVYGEQNQKLTNNDFSTALDFNLYKTLPHFNYWGLANYNTSYSLKINHQLLTGLGVAYALIDKANQKLKISNGILYDKSDIVVNDVQEVYSTFRNSLRISFKFTAFKLINLQNTTFHQISFKDKTDYSIRSNSSASIKLNNWLAFNTALVYNKYNKTNRENLLFSYGLKAEKYF